MNQSRALLMATLRMLPPLLLTACAAPTTVKGTDDTSRTIIAHKEKMITGIDRFNFDNRESIHKTTDDVSRLLNRTSKSNVVKTIHTDTVEMRPVLKLVDKDGDGKPDEFIYIKKDTEKWDTPDYGYIYDLNRDGRIDYIVFNQGIVPGKDETNPFKFVHTLYHWIDSNNDGNVDIWVYPDIDLDEDGMVDNELYGWLYDEKGDGLVDSGEYIGPAIKQAIEIVDGVVNIKRFGHDSLASVNDNLSNIQKLSNKILADINSNIE